MPSAAEERPPLISFEMRAIEDRGKTIDTGRYSVREVPFILVTPPGSRDQFEGPVDEWVERRRADVAQKRFREEWLTQVEQGFKRWLDGEKEMPVNGFPIERWPAISQAQVKVLRHANIRSVEDLAAASDAALNLIGMGARAMQTLAKEWLASAQNVGVPAAEVAELKAKVATLTAQNSALEQKLKELRAKLETQHDAA